MYQRQRKNTYNLRIGREDGFLADALWAFKSKKKVGTTTKKWTAHLLQSGFPVFY